MGTMRKTFTSLQAEQKGTEQTDFDGSRSRELIELYLEQLRKDWMSAPCLIFLFTFLA